MLNKNQPTKSVKEIGNNSSNHNFLHHQQDGKNSNPIILSQEIQKIQQTNKLLTELNSILPSMATSGESY